MESSQAEWILLGTLVGGADYGLHFSVHLLVILTQLIQFKGMHSMSMTLLARAVDLDSFLQIRIPLFFSTLIRIQLFFLMQIRIRIQLKRSVLKR